MCERAPVNVTHALPPLQRPSSAGSRRSDVIGSSLRGRGEVSAGLRSPHSQHLGRLESRHSVESTRLGEGAGFSGAAGDGVRAVNLMHGVIDQMWV